MMENNTFSLSRMYMLARFYWPAMRWQLGLSAAVVLASYIIALFSGLHVRMDAQGGPTFPIILYSMAEGIAGWVIYLAPLLFAFVGQRAVITTLPASWQEKAVFMLAYVLVVIPGLYFIVWYAGVGVASLYTPHANITAYIINIISSTDPQVRGLLNSMIPHMEFNSSLTTLMPLALSCFLIEYSRRNRLAMGIVGIVGGQIIVFIMSMACTIFTIVRAVKDTIDSNVDEMPDLIVHGLMDTIQIGSMVVTAAAVVLLILTVRKIKTRQD